MKRELLTWLCCPSCKGGLEAEATERKGEEIREGTLLCRCGRRYPIYRAIPRFVNGRTYADSFGFEWKIHRWTQLDSHNHHHVSERAFQSRIDFPLEHLSGKVVLDAGCGMGRYAEIASRHGSTVVALDLSGAVDVAYENLSSHPNVHFVQADICNPPFPEGAFNFIYSFGVLHHTPHPKEAFQKLSLLLKKEGKIAIFVYSSYNKAIWVGSDFWRQWTTRLPKRVLYSFCTLSIPLYYLYRIPVMGHCLKAIFLISMEKDWRWRLLDTFDWYSPKFMSKHTHAEVFRWFEESALKGIKVFEGGVTMMGTKG